MTMHKPDFLRLAATATIIALSGCGESIPPPEPVSLRTDLKIDSCHMSYEFAVARAVENGGDKIEGDVEGADFWAQRHYQLAVEGFESIAAYRASVRESGLLEHHPRWNRTGRKFVCNEDELSFAWSFYIDAMYGERTLPDLDAMNREIDAALDSIIEDYRRKAVSHYVANGSGPVKVDAFVMPDGETVYCRTTISDAGKAVSCSP